MVMDSSQVRPTLSLCLSLISSKSSLPLDSSNFFCGSLDLPLNIQDQRNVLVFAEWPHASARQMSISFIFSLIIIIINPLTARVVGAPQMILQPVFSIFPWSPLPSGTCRTPGLSIPWCCLPTSSFVRLVFFPLSLCLARWFWPDLMNVKHDHTTAVCVFLR